jgi:hypothetical protein
MNILWKIRKNAFFLNCTRQQNDLHIRDVFIMGYGDYLHMPHSGTGCSNGMYYPLERYSITLQK